MPADADSAALFVHLVGLEERLLEQLADLRARVEGLDRRIDQRLAELRVKQEEDLMLVKALSCQLRGRVGRAERRPLRGGA